MLEGAGRSAACGRVQVTTNGCFVDAKPGMDGLVLRAALEKSDGRVWVELSQSRKPEAVGRVGTQRWQWLCGRSRE